MCAAIGNYHGSLRRADLAADQVRTAVMGNVQRRATMPMLRLRGPHRRDAAACPAFAGRDAFGGLAAQADQYGRRFTIN